MTTTGIPRPMKFSRLQDFVFGTSGEFNQSNNSQFPKTIQNFKKQLFLYDRYNVQNLQLNKVHKNHLQVLQKNIVLVQEDLKPNNITNNLNGKNNSNFMKQQKRHSNMNNFMQTNFTGNNYYLSNKNSSPQKSNQIIAKTHQQFFIQQQNTQKSSKEYSQNQFLFNFKKISEQKKARKKQFLESMQQKLNKIQQQTKQLQNCHYEQELQLRQIQKIHHQIGNQLHQNTFTGNINKKIYQALNQDNDFNQFQQSQNIKKPTSLHPDMSPIQINHALTSHFSENQKLLNQISKVKNKSIQKSFNSQQKMNFSPVKNSSTNKSFQKTSKINNQKSNQKIAENNKKNIYSMTMKLPPKQNKH